MNDKVKKTQSGDAASEGSAADKAESKSVLRFNSKISIYTGRPHDKYHVNGIKAYHAESRGRDKEKFYALVCVPQLLARLRHAPLYSRMRDTHLAGLVEYGVRYWPPAGEERLILIYRDDMGDRLVEDGQDIGIAMGLSQEEVLINFVKPMVAALKEMHNRDFVHGNIRLSNMFRGRGGGEKSQEIFLGDCLAMPSSYSQPVLYLTIERGMADAIGRGLGASADDIYAFGVVLACLMRHQDPLAGKSDREITFAKIEQGSYAAITGRDRFTGSILELLRGTLHDDPRQRWTIDEIVSWADGRRLSPKQAMRQVKAPRAFDFAEGKYYYKNHLAMDLEKDPKDVQRICETNELGQWISRSLQDEELLLRYEKACESLRSYEVGKAGFESRLAAYVSIALDPGAPIRYKGLHLMGDGLGVALADALITGKKTHPFAEIFTRNIVTNWLGVQFQSVFDVSSLMSKCDAARTFLKQGVIGSGVERVAYNFSPELHCLSPNLEGYLVYDSENLLKAYEKICEKGAAPRSFIDRHCAAFLLDRDAKVIDTMIYELASPEEHKVILAELRCLASIQYRYKMPLMPHVGQALLKMMPPVLARYHDADARASVQKQLDKFAQEGDLVKMANVLDNQDVRRKDILAFRQAMREYAELRKERNEITERLSDDNNYMYMAGKAAAAFISLLLGGGVILIVAVLYMSRGPTF